MTEKNRRDGAESRERLLAFIVSYIDRAGFPPTFREMMEGAQMKSESVVGYHLDRLEAEGSIERAPTISRGIRIPEKTLALFHKQGDTMEENNKPEKLDLVEPESDKIEEIIELYLRATAEFKTTREREYWQGRKDGIRAALAILEPGDRSWADLNRSSHGFRLEEKEALLESLKDARYNIGAALDDYAERDDRRIYLQTIVNLLQWLDSYDRLSKDGRRLPAEDAITPDWAKLTKTRSRR